MPRWSRFAPAADRRLVKGLHDGDDDVLATLYDLYAERLYDYSVALLDDSKAAADVLHDTFIDAARRAPRMRERAQLRPWLYAAVRRRCLQRKRQAPPDDGRPLARLDRLQREVLVLGLRHDVTGDDLSATLGVSPRRAHRRLARAEAHAPDAGKFLNTAPAPVLPAALRHRVLHTGTDPELAGYRTEIAARGGPLTADGLPRQPDAPSRLARRWAYASGGSLAMLATAVVALLIVGPHLPVPEIQWPGGKPPPHSVRSPHPHRAAPSAPSAPTAQPSPQPPRSAPQLMPSVPPPGSLTLAPSPTPVRVGVIDVKPRSIHLTGHDTLATFAVTAVGGAVSWTASETSPQITLSRTSGYLRSGDRVTIQVMLDRGLVTLPGATTVDVIDERGHDTPVSVAWDTSLL